MERWLATANRIHPKSFLKLILVIQSVAFGSIGLDYMGIGIPLMRLLFCFIYLAFVPGILILGILGLDQLSIIETVLYSIGLSNSFLTFVGLFINMVFPVFGFTEPLSTTSLLATFITLISILYVLCCIQNPNYTPHSFTDLNIGLLFSLYTLSFFLMPFLAVFGAYIVQFYNNNILLLLLLALISVFPILVVFDKIPSNMFPLLVFVIAISLLLHNDLSSMYIQGSDLHIEYYFANSVKSNSLWDVSVPHRSNTALNVVMLAPIFSNICDISLTWVLKLIYPFTFSLMPLALYQVYKKQTNAKVAFLSSFFLMSVITFYTEMLQLAKQMMAEFFLSLLVLLIISKHAKSTDTTFLSILFMLSMVVSHYATSYIFLISLFFVYLAALLWRKNVSNFDVKLVKHTFTALSVISALAWYIYTSGSSAFESAVKIGDHVIRNIAVFSPKEGGSVYWLIRELSLTEQILRVLYIISVLLIIIGFLDVLLHKSLKKKGNILDDEFMFFSVAFIGWLAIAALLPPVAASGTFGFTRLFHICSLFSAPFCIIGGIRLERAVLKLLKHGAVNSILNAKATIKGVSIFLTIFLLFNSSFVSEIVQETIGGDHAVSLSISQPRIEKDGDVSEKIAYYSWSDPIYDVTSAKWLGIHIASQKEVFVDSLNGIHVLASSGMIWGNTIRMDPTNLEEAVFRHKESYIFLRKINYIENIMRLDYFFQKEIGYERNWWNASEMLPTLDKERNKIYCNGGSAIYE